MRRAGRVRATLALGAQTATLGSVVMLLLSLHALATGGARAAAADGPQATPSLAPAAVVAATDAFSIVPPPDARCDGSGADGWRWHTFIVEAGRDLSTLRFGPFGPGDDYDASDGEITAGLISAGDGVWQELPALKPEGLVNPNDLGGLVLDPSTYTFRDGDYEIGMACTDGEVATRQWWSVVVTVDAAGEPFLTVAGQGAAAAPPTTASTAAPTPPAAAGASTAPTGEPQGVQAASAELATTATISTAIDVPSPTGVSWAPLLAFTDISSRLPVAGWAVLAAVLARVAYLLARPVRVLSPRSS